MKGLKLTALALCLLNGTVRLHAQSNALSLSASTLEFSATSQDQTPPSQTVLVKETLRMFDTTVGYMSPEEGWLAAESFADKVVVSVNPHGLATGFYMGYVKLKAGQSASAVTITLKVGEPKGVQVIAWISSANRDEDAFP